VPFCRAKVRDARREKVPRLLHDSPIFRDAGRAQSEGDPPAIGEGNFAHNEDACLRVHRSILTRMVESHPRNSARSRSFTPLLRPTKAERAELGHGKIGPFAPAHVGADSPHDQRNDVEHFRGTGFRVA
jgi:hypothetical protein